MYAITGVTGHTGRATAETLLSQGHRVRVVVRDAAKGEPWRQKGCEVAVADLGDTAALARALEGTEGVYLLSPPNYAATDFLADRKALLERIVEAVKEAKVPNLVFLSSLGAHLPAGTGPIVSLYHAEQSLRNIAPSVTFIRAAFFLENWAPVVSAARAQGVLPHYGPTDVKFPQICAPDIGEALAKALLASVPGTRVVELAGLEDWSVEDVAAALGKLIERPVKAVSMPVEAARAGLEQTGMPAEPARLLAELYQALAQGLVAAERPASMSRGSTPLLTALRAML